MRSIVQTQNRLSTYTKLDMSRIMVQAIMACAYCSLAKDEN